MVPQARLLDMLVAEADVRARIVVGADGRFSRLRTMAGLEPIRTAPPFDLLWFRLPRRDTDPPGGVYPLRLRQDEVACRTLA